VYLVPVSTHLVEIEHQIQLAHIPKEGIQDLHKEMYGLQIRQFVVIRIDAGAEEQARIPSVHNLGHVSKLDKVGLVLLVSRGDEAVDLHIGWLIRIFDYCSLLCGIEVAHGEAFEAHSGSPGEE
jgi:hypothetical protein